MASCMDSKIVTCTPCMSAILVTVVYRVIGSDDPYASPNAFYMQIADREIYLFDVMSAMLTNELPISFSYHAHLNHKGDKVVVLVSPSSVVPILADNVIILTLIPAGAPPVCPIGQVVTYNDNSRQSLYTKKSWAAASEHAQQFGSKRKYDVRTNQFRVKSLPSTQWLPPSKSTINITIFGGSQAQVKEEGCSMSRGSNQASSQPSSATVDPFEKSDAFTEPATKSPQVAKAAKPTKIKSPHVNPLHSADEEPNTHGRAGDAFNSFINSSNTENDAVAAAVDVAKDVTKALGKSLLSFASFGLKAVGEVAAAAQGSYQAHTNQVIQVGEMQVTVARELAEGGFGTVYLVNSNGRSFAMKKMLCQTREQVTDAQRELDALIQFSGKSENIIRLLDHSITSGQGGKKNILKEIYMVFPLFSQGTAWDAIERAVPRELDGCPWPFPEQRAISVLLGTCHGLLVLHNSGVAHRDVKPHNILLSDDGTPVVMDLGSVTKARVEVKTRTQALNVEEEAAQKTSAPYRCPELTATPNPIQIDERVDVWGVGCTMFCLAFGRSPFETAKEGVLRLAILNGRYQPPAGNRMRQCTFTSGYMNLIQKMLEVDHTNRPFLPEVIDTLESLLR